ncbi:MAG: hypothetical protein V3T05_01750 [Myxococcota bacterium]
MLDSGHAGFDLVHAPVDSRVASSRVGEASEHGFPEFVHAHIKSRHRFLVAHKQLPVPYQEICSSRQRFIDARKVLLVPYLPIGYFVDGSRGALEQFLNLSIHTSIMPTATVLRKNIESTKRVVTV